MVRYRSCASASRMPMNTNTLPTQRLNQRLNTALGASRLLRRAVDHATNRFHSVPLKSNMPPRKRNASGFELASEATNCGRNARKNNATLGFKTLVRKPWTKTLRIEAGRTTAVPGEEWVAPAERISEIP